jgi:hypothetical protein
MQVGVGLPPSKLTLSNGNAAVVERNNAPSITTLTKVFFIEFFFSLVCKIAAVSFSCSSVSHTIYWLYWEFPNLEQIFPNWE